MVRCMDGLGVWMNSLCDYFDGHYDEKDSRTENVMMRRFSKVGVLVAQDDHSDEANACWVYCCGSSVLIPMLHAFLGIPKKACNMGIKTELPQQYTQHALASSE